MEDTSTRPLIWCATLSLFAFYVGDRWGMSALGYSDLIEGFNAAFSADLLFEILLEPYKLSFETVPLIVGLTLCVGVWYLFVTFGPTEREIMRTHEHAAGHAGTIQDARAYRDRKHRENNIVLSRHVMMAIEANDWVKKSVTSTNCLVIGPTGTGKTCGFVLPNILQFADRDLVVVDPKGSTLLSTGHALAAAGFDISVLNTTNPEESDHFNPLANIYTYEDIREFVECLMANTNKGRQSMDPLWENGEAMVYQMTLTLLLDWFDRSELTFANMHALVDLVQVTSDDEEDKCPFELIIDEIRYGMRWVPDESLTTTRSPFEPVSPEAHPGLLRVPSLMRRRDGARPALKGKDGRRGLPNDRTVKLWEQFRSGSEKTLRSFIISVESRLNNIDSPDVMKLLAGLDGQDELHLERLGQRTDLYGRPYAPRVVFIISSDVSDTMSPVLAMACWQAIKLPINAADRGERKRLERHVSIILDEFANIGHIAGLERSISVVRSRNIDIQIMLQSIAQLDNLYNAPTSTIIQENLTNTVFLGGANASYSAEIIARRMGKTTAYKQERSTTKGASGTSTSTSTVAYERDVRDKSEIVNLTDDQCLVLLGSVGAIEDEKAHVRHAPHYDRAYMAKEARKSFNYAAWKAAGRPRGEALCAWERIWFQDEKDASDAVRDLDAKHADAALALAGTRRDAVRGDAAATATLPLLEQRLRLREAQLEAARATLAYHHARACEAAGHPTDGPMPTRDDARLLEQEAGALEGRLREVLSPEAAEIVFG